MKNVRTVLRTGASPTGGGVSLTTSGRGRVLRFAAVCLSLLAVALVSAAWAQPTYFIQADTVRGAIGAQGAVCVGNAVFMKGEQIVFRAYVYDASTGVALTPDEAAARGLQAYGVLDGQRVVELALIPHPPEAPQTELFWAGGWSIPADYPSGNYAWSVEVEDASGNTAAYLPMGQSVGLGTLMILEPTTDSSASLNGADTEPTFHATGTTEMDAN